MAETIWVKTAWVDSSDGPYMVAAYDEWTFESWGGEPVFYIEDIKKHEGDGVREMYVHVPADAVRALFAAPHVKGEVLDFEGNLDPRHMRGGAYG